MYILVFIQHKCIHKCIHVSNIISDLILILCMLSIIVDTMHTNIRFFLQCRPLSVHVLPMTKTNISGLYPFPLLTNTNVFPFNVPNLVSTGEVYRLLLCMMLRSNPTTRMRAENVVYCEILIT